MSNNIENEKIITMRSVVLNAITNGTAREHVVNYNNIENAERHVTQMEGVTKDD